VLLQAVFLETMFFEAVFLEPVAAVRFLAHSRLLSAAWGRI
jgi:hypothetical protein